MKQAAVQDPLGDDVFSIEALATALAGDRDLSATLAKGCLPDIAGQVSELEKSGGGSIEHLRGISHKIKGAGGNIRASRLADDVEGEIASPGAGPGRGSGTVNRWAHLTFLADSFGSEQLSKNWA